MDGDFWNVFRASRNAMLLADDDRRFVEANDAALALLGVSRDRLTDLRIDDIAFDGADLDEDWSSFLEQGSRTGRWRIVRDGREVEIEYSATVNVLPGRHLSIILAPAPEELEAPSSNGTHEPLTAREREVVVAIAKGHTTGQIAELLYVSPATVETHVRKAMLRLGARNRAHLIAVALERGEL